MEGRGRAGGNPEPGSVVRCCAGAGFVLCSGEGLDRGVVATSRPHNRNPSPMRLLCPFCQKAITVPDSEAGKAVRCPECSQQFAAPQLFSPTASSPDLSMTPPPPAEPPPSELFTPSSPYERDRLPSVPPDLPQLP